jgi:hypothetical protein
MSGSEGGGIETNRCFLPLFVTPSRPEAGSNSVRHDQVTCT